MKKIAISLLLTFLFSASLKAQEVNQNRKKIEAKRVENAPKIDGKLNDAVWKNVPIAKDFIMMRPTNGDKEPASHKTEVKLIYDDNAIYVSAKMWAPDPTKIPAEFTSRDNIGNADFFMLMINPNDDGQNPTMFIVTASGVQVDSKVSNGNEDFNWNAVWESAHKMTDFGWTVEMKIPYRALRFANEEVQSWGINFHREVRNLNARFTWNFIDNTQARWTQYDGLYENFRNIKPPTRLSFYPYASVISNTYDGLTIADWNVGMDVKYGLTENFTLDATLVPDFSQAGFDNITLNLGPFEQQFSEQRQFFTEGTELFTKGRLFYSRRIGGSPIDQFAGDRNLIEETDFTNGTRVNEKTIEYPGKVQLLNAVKVSGRTKGGLGIGFFNAITDKTELTIEKTTEQELTGGEIETTKELRKETTNPFSNYNIMVLDQQFNQNSAVTLINTNVTRDGNFRDANATGLLWHLEDKGSNYNIDGSIKMTSISDDVNNPNTGYSFDTSIGKQSGNWTGEIGYNFENKDFNPNDLGILFSNNEQTIYGNAAYRILQPKGKYNDYRFGGYYNINFQHASGIFTGVNAGLNARGFTKNRNAYGFNLNYGSKSKDFFEPRQGTTSGVFFKRPMRLNFNSWVSTDFRKKFALDFNFYHNFFGEVISGKNQRGYGFGFRPRYRFNNQFALVYGLNFNKSENEFGYVNETTAEGIIFGQRDRTSYNNSLTGKYTFSNISALSMSFRHNWSKVPYRDFYSLNTIKGSLNTSNYSETHDVNFNSWNLDVNYLWQFAPGSQLIAFYRNSISNFNDNATQSFSENLGNLFKEPNQHIFSLRLVYFIDYNNVKNIF